MERRTFLGAVVSAPVVAACTKMDNNTRTPAPAVLRGPREDLVRSVEPLGFPWRTQDPFLFCVHHNDRFPRGNGQLGPAASLAGRNIGMDFDWRDGWNMYHGETVPGFPQHPHRGFETVTIARQGLVDHADSMGATARYGDGDVQWLTAGDGIVHAEMFPLLRQDAPNPMDLFQIWLNLPRANKRVPPHFAMLWASQIPRFHHLDREGRATEVTVMAGDLHGLRTPAPPPHSWASRQSARIAIANFALAPRAVYTLAADDPAVNRTLYFYKGERVRLGGRDVNVRHLAVLHAGQEAVIENGDAPAELLLLQGRPIGEPVVQRGPFVMNSVDEIRQAHLDYQRTQFGGWPWPHSAPTNGFESQRFARHADGRTERAPG